MRIIVLNGSPKGEYSVTLQYVNLVKKIFEEHDFLIIHISKRIKKIEKDLHLFNQIIEDVKTSDLVLWSFGLWVLAVPAQYMRFIELIMERKAESAFNNKYTAVISTSIHFYDHTAHNYMRAVCEDLDMQFVEGISFDMMDLMQEKERGDLITFFENIIRTVEKKTVMSKMYPPLQFNHFVYEPSHDSDNIKTNKKVLVIADYYEENSNLGRMIHRFSSSFENAAEVIPLNAINIKGACLGCMRCGYDYQCHYNDEFTDFYNNRVRKADVIVIAGTMNGRYLSSKWKTFFDRAFFWNHTPSLVGKQIAYLISGPVSQNYNLVQILEATVTARQMANMVDIVSDECSDSNEIDATLQGLAEQVVYYSERNYIRPFNFLGVGGHKIFRDDVWGRIRGIWQADHRYYKRHGLYDFPQKKIGLRIMNFFLLLACKVPYIRKKYYDNVKKFPAVRYGKLIEKLIRKGGYKYSGI